MRKHSIKQLKNQIDLCNKTELQDLAKYITGKLGVTVILADNSHSEPVGICDFEMYLKPSGN